MLDLTPETEALARRIAVEKPLSVEVVVRGALEAREGLPAKSKPKDMFSDAVTLRKPQIERIVEDIAALPILDDRPLADLIDDLNALLFKGEDFPPTDVACCV